MLVHGLHKLASSISGIARRPVPKEGTGESDWLIGLEANEQQRFFSDV